MLSGRMLRRGFGLLWGVVVVLVASLPTSAPGAHGQGTVRPAVFLPFVAQKRAPRLVYASNRDAPGQEVPISLYIAFANGSEGTRLTNAPLADAFPAWSPNGNRIAFTRFFSDTDPQIFVVNIDGSQLVQLTPAGSQNAFPVWSPTGTQIAFVSAPRGQPGDIFVMNADGTNRHNLTNTPTINEGTFNGAWSPDGSKILIESNRDGNSDIYTLAADGSSVVNLTNTISTTNTNASWSPDGRQIVFTSDRDGDYEIYRMNSDGTQLTRLTTSAGTDDLAAWSPDGSMIAFVSGRDSSSKYFQIFLMQPDGSGVVQLTHGTNYAAITPAWEPLRPSTEIACGACECTGCQPISSQATPASAAVPKAEDTASGKHFWRIQSLRVP